MPKLDVDSLKKKHGRNVKISNGKKPPLVEPPAAKNEEDPFGDYSQTVQGQRELAEKRELIRKIFDDNTELPVEDMLMHYFTQGDGKKLGKSVSPLKGIREGLEDMLNIQQLKDLVQGFRNIKEQPKREEEDMGNNNDMMAMLPLLQKMQGGNGQIDPMLMMMLMNNSGGQKSNNNNMGQLYLMMSMLNMNTNQQQPQKTNPNGTPFQPNQPNAEMIKSIYEELQKVMNQQQQKPAIDPLTLMMMQSINNQNKNQAQNSGGGNIEVLFDKLNSIQNNNQTQQMSMIMQQNADRFERSMEMIASTMNRENPMDTLMRGVQLSRELTGDKRERSEQEMNYDLKKKEIEIQEMGRRDMLDREERAEVRENEKGNRIMDTASTVLDKVIGNGLGQLVGDLMSAKKPSSGRRGRGESKSQEDFDSSLLDDL